MTHEDPLSTKTDSVQIRKPIIQGTRTKRICGTQTAAASRTASVLHCVLLEGLATDISDYFNDNEWLLRDTVLETRLSRLRDYIFLSLHLVKYLFVRLDFLRLYFYEIRNVLYKLYQIKKKSTEPSDRTY
jgi:hypothetical protein